jgi:hypothetical protein
MLGEQLEQRGESRQVVTDAPFRDQLAVVVDKSDVMVALGPINAAPDLVVAFLPGSGCARPSSAARRA